VLTGPVATFTINSCVTGSTNRRLLAFAESNSVTVVTIATGTSP